MEEEKCCKCGEMIAECKCGEKCTCTEECKCDDDNCECGCNFTAEDLLCHTDDKIEALIELLIKKGVITEKEYDEAYTDLMNELEKSSDE